MDDSVEITISRKTLVCLAVLKFSAVIVGPRLLLLSTRRERVSRFLEDDCASLRQLQSRRHRRCRTQNKVRRVYFQ